MKRLVTAILLVFVMAGSGYAFNLNQATCKDPKAGIPDIFEHLIAPANRYIADIRNAVENYPYKDVAVRYNSYLRTLTEGLKSRLGPEFELSPETGQGQLPMSGKVAKYIFSFTNWQVVKVTMYFPHGTVYEFNIDTTTPYSGFLMARTPSTDNFIYVKLNGVTCKGQVIDAKLPFVAIKEDLSKGSQKQKYTQPQDTVSSNSQSLSIIATVTKNKLLTAIDRYMNYVSKSSLNQLAEIDLLLRGDTIQEFQKFLK